MQCNHHIKMYQTLIASLFLSSLAQLWHGLLQKVFYVMSVILKNDEACYEFKVSQNGPMVACGFLLQKYCREGDDKPLFLNNWLLFLLFL